jgi:hypothetical protein
MISAKDALQLSQSGMADRLRFAEEAKAIVERERQIEIRKDFPIRVNQAEMTVLESASKGERKAVLEFLPLHGCKSALVSEVPGPYGELAKIFAEDGYEVTLVSSEAIEDDAFPMYFVLGW